MSTCKRYYLMPDGSLCAVEEPGHCDWYWTLYIRWVQLANQVAPTIDKEAALAEAVEAARRDIQNHIEVCPQCRSWFEQCEQAGHGQPAAQIEVEPPAPAQALFVN